MKQLLIILVCLGAIISLPVEEDKHTEEPEFLNLSKMVMRLEEFAPLVTATEWDNVGLLVEPSGNFLVKRMLVTNDLTKDVLDEAIEKKVDLIVSYHPPMTKSPPFTNLEPTTRLTLNTWKQWTIIRCIENRIAVYSPHTTWDSIDGGINDWILSAFNTSKVESIKKTRSPETPSGFDKSVKLLTSTRFTGELEDILRGKSERFNLKSSNVEFLDIKEVEGNKANTEMEFLANDNGILEIINLINEVYKDDADLRIALIKTMRITELIKPLMKNVGLGRIGFLKEFISIRDVITKMKTLLNQKTFRLALANDKSLDDMVGVLAVGAGSGQGLLNNTIADFIITGELTHHDILHETHRGTSVLITDHSNTERGFINVFKKRFNEALLKKNEQVEILVSEFDHDPIQYI